MSYVKERFINFIDELKKEFKNIEIEHLYTRKFTNWDLKKRMRILKVIRFLDKFSESRRKEVYEETRNIIKKYIDRYKKYLIVYRNASDRGHSRLFIIAKTN